MGTHGAAGTRARALPPGSNTVSSTAVNFVRRRPFNLSDWPVARRLFAVIVAALLMGVIFGGLRVADAESSAAQYSRVSQLANLGQKLTVLVDDLQNERDETLSLLTRARAGGLNTMKPFFDRTDAGGRGGPAGVRYRRPAREHPERHHHRHRRHQTVAHRGAAGDARAAAGRVLGHRELRGRHQRHDRPGRPGRSGCLRRDPGQRCAGVQRAGPGQGAGVRAARPAQLRLRQPDRSPRLVLDRPQGRDRTRHWR